MKWIWRGLLLVLAGASALPAGAATAAVARGPSRILYSSDWLGPTQIFAVDPSSRMPLAQLTFDRNFGCKYTTFACGFTDPVPSPNGRRVAYGEVGVTYDAGWLRPRTLWIADADGRHAVKLHAGCCTTWSPDSRRLAYAESDGRDLHWHVVRADGTLDRVVAGQPNWVAKAREQLRSPNGRFLAKATSDAILINSRVVAQEPGFSLSWSPDSRELAYISGVRRANGTNDEDSATGDVKIVTPAGRLQTVVEARGRFGGQIDSLNWTRVPDRTAYRPPQTTDGVFAGGPVVRLAADGLRAAFSACNHVYVWTPSTGVTLQVDGRRDEGALRHCLSPENRLGVYDLALAGERVAWASGWFGLSVEEEVISANLATPPQRFSLLKGRGYQGGTEGRGGQLVGVLAGTGETLVFGAWSTPWDGAAYTTTTETLYRATTAGCPCPAIAYAAAPRGTAPLVPLDTNGAQIAVLRYGSLVVLDANGGDMLELPVNAAAAQFAGDSLVVLVRGALRVYDTSTGRLRATWQLPDATVGRDCTYYSEPHAEAVGADACPGTAALVLQDANERFAAYTFDDRLHVVRIVDGRDKTIGYATRARFMAAGLVYADGARVRLIPYSSLAQR